MAIWHRILSFFWRLIFPSAIWPKQLDLLNTQTCDSWRWSADHQVICILSEHSFRKQKSPRATTRTPFSSRPSALLGNGLASHLGLRIHLNNGWDPPTVNAPGNRSKSKRKIIFQPMIFRSELLVSGRVSLAHLAHHFLHQPKKELHSPPEEKFAKRSKHAVWTARIIQIIVGAFGKQHVKLFLLKQTCWSSNSFCELVVRTSMVSGNIITYIPQLACRHASSTASETFKPLEEQQL